MKWMKDPNGSTVLNRLGQGYLVWLLVTKCFKYVWKHSYKILFGAIVGGEITLHRLYKDAQKYKCTQIVLHTERIKLNLSTVCLWLRALNEK